MSKYYKAEEVERLIDNVINVMIGKEEPITTSLADLPTIEIPTELNGVVLKDCDKVIAPFLKEHECDELWETVRALRDFYDWVTEEERIDK